jgi:site-specific DNA recombinase
VTEIFERRAAGEAWNALCKWLNGAGIATKHGSAWTAGKLSDAVKKRVYLGEATDGRNVFEGAHPPLTDRVTWEMVQGMRTARGGRREGSPLLSGLVRCAGCRYMASGVVDGMNGGRGSAAYHYRCARGPERGCERPPRSHRPE